MKSASRAKRSRLVVATNNPDKRQEIEEILSGMGWKILSLKDFPYCPVAKEDGDTFFANAYQKAALVSHHTGLAALADDSGLVVDALGGAPGIHSARYGKGKGSTYEDNIDRLLRELQGVPEAERTAHFQCVAVVVWGVLPGMVVAQAEGRVDGLILEERRGQGGFGFDPVFYCPAAGATFAEISGEAKHRLSHRGIALRKIREQLEQLG